MTTSAQEKKPGNGQAVAPGRWRYLVLGSFYGLLLYFTVLSTMALNGIRPTTLVIWLFYCLPLLLFAPSLHRGFLRGYAWLSFLSLLYFMHAVLLAFDPAMRLMGLLEVTLTSVLFIGLMYYIRTARDETGASLQTSQADSARQSAALDKEP